MLAHIVPFCEENQCGLARFAEQTGKITQELSVQHDMKLLYFLNVSLNFEQIEK